MAGRSPPLREPPAPLLGSAARAAPALQVKSRRRRGRGPAVTPTGEERTERSFPRRRATCAALAEERSRPPGKHRPAVASPRFAPLRSFALLPRCDTASGALTRGGGDRGAAGGVSSLRRLPALSAVRVGTGGAAGRVRRAQGGGDEPCGSARVAPAPAPAVSPRPSAEKRRGAAAGRRRGKRRRPPGGLSVSLCSWRRRSLGRRRGSGTSSRPLTCAVRLEVSTLRGGGHRC